MKKRYNNLADVITRIVLLGCTSQEEIYSRAVGLLSLAWFLLAGMAAEAMLYTWACTDPIHLYSAIGAATGFVLWMSLAIITMRSLNNEEPIHGIGMHVLVPFLFCISLFVEIIYTQIHPERFWWHAGIAVFCLLASIFSFVKYMCTAK